jgi:ribosomal protein S18 acetylase RimI-like enzyme
MDKISSFLDIQGVIKTIKAINKGIVSNFYPEVDKVNSWISHGQLSKIDLGETVVFLRKETAFSYMYYCSASLESLNKALFQLKSITGDMLLVVDIIGKNPDIQPITSVFNKNGYYVYTILNRMSRSTTAEETSNASPLLLKADLSHADAISGLLHHYFDPIAEQLPTFDEIKKWIEVNHLILMVEDGEILGFVIFDIIGVTSYLRYWFVHPQHRNRKIGSTLLNEYFNCSSNTKRQLFWVIQSNENAINRYLHYGFQPENLIDHIVTNKNIHYETKDY